jgi:putative flippase GtrA
MGRYVISGGIATFVDLILLYLFTNIFGIWYIISAIMAFLFAFMVSFSLQKYWTFKDHSSHNIHFQALKYFTVTSINLGLNTLGIFIFVEYGHFHYLASQFIVSALIAVESYFIYHYIFKENQ